MCLHLYWLLIASYLNLNKDGCLLVGPQFGPEFRPKNFLKIWPVKPDPTYKYAPKQVAS